MKNILVIQTASIGDVILVTPVIEALHQLYSQANIDILVKKGNESLFNGHPFLRNVWSWNKSDKKYVNLFQLIRQLRKKKYDLCINAQRFFSSGLITVLSGSKITSGFDKNPLSYLFSHRISHKIGADSPHEAERNLSLIPGFTLIPGSAKICLYPQRTDYEKVSIYKQGDYITISPASLWFTKQYPVEKWLELIREIPEKFTVYITGSKKEKEMANYLLANTSRQNVFNLCGELNLLQSAALMENASMNYVNDSAPLHLCSSRNAAVTAIFCSTIPAFGFGPYGNRGEIVETQENLNCRPCGLHGQKSCPESHFKCAYSIITQELVNKLQR